MVIIKTVSLLCQTEPPPFTTNSRTTNICFLVRFAGITRSPLIEVNWKMAPSLLEQIIRSKVDLRILNYTSTKCQIQTKLFRSFSVVWMDGLVGYS